MKRIALALFFTLGVASGAFAHNGIFDFIPTVPDPNLMTIDGNDDDWGWIEADFIVTPDEIYDSHGQHKGGGADPAPEDFSVMIMYAWSPPPDNSIYLFSRGFDDTLRAGESEVKRNWWNDDTLQFDMDMDHTGGPMSWVSTEETRNGYRINMHPLFDEQLGGTISIDYQEPGFEDWGALPPYAYTATTVLPKDATHMSANIEFTYEMRVANPMVTYDILGPDVSTPHIFEADQVIHLKTTWHDGDAEANGQQSIWTRDPDEWSAANGDFMYDYQVIATVDLDDYPDVDTSVESATWGRIKSHINQN
jgi:hypothetical protein